MIIGVEMLNEDSLLYNRFMMLLIIVICHILLLE